MQNLKLLRLEADLKRALNDICFNLGYSNLLIERVVLNKNFDYLDIEITTEKSNLLFLLKSLKNDEKRLKYFLSKYVNLRKMPVLRFKEYVIGEKMNKINQLLDKIKES